MTLSVASDGTATGTLLLGNGALLKPPTDPDVGYPPGVNFPMGGPLGFFEGFPYTMIDGRLSRSTLTFRVAEFELWKQWCSLQKPVFFVRDPEGGVFYGCLPNGGGSSFGGACSYQDPSTMQDVPVDCGRLILCELNSPCDCSATACGARDWMNPEAFDQPGTEEPTLSFDLTISGDTADGTLSGLLGDHAVHFVRAP
jgi:hypothetical protein